MYQFYDEHKNPNSLKAQEMVLEIGEKCSKFYSTYRQYTDSLFMLNAKVPSNATFSNVRSKTANTSSNLFSSYYVYKNYPEPNKTLFTAWDMKVNHYKVVEEIDFEWQIDNNAKATILGMTCVKATCGFAGRNYEAWFTTEIPISDGPYKFRGLPGLIVRLTDSDKEHVFELLEIKKTKNIPMYFVDRKYINTNAKGYVTGLEASKASHIDQLNGLDYSDESMRSRAISNVQKRNNFIERF
jgi:GLPGLI family protein